MVDKKLILDMLDKLPYAMQVSLLAGLTTGLTVADTKGVPHNDTSSPLPRPGAPSAEQLFATLVSLFEDQEGVKIDYTIVDGDGKDGHKDA